VRASETITLSFYIGSVLVRTLCPYMVRGQAGVMEISEAFRFDHGLMEEGGPDGD
jgi:hypothetical protein